MTHSTEKEATRALLVQIRLPRQTDAECEASLRELERLVNTLGFTVVGTEGQRLPSSTGATAVGAGKLEEIAEKTRPGPDAEANKTRPNAVVFDCDLSPAQLRHIEGSLGCEVLDRTGVIIEIFSRHARSRAARLEVEIARLNYLSPRIREVGSSGERQSGRGSGESALAIGRREIRDKLAALKKDLAAAQSEQGQRRQLRSEQPCAALVGYTNAGKSSTMRALTGSDVLVEDKLFATLDTTVRALQPETSPRILISDTVGFIHKLPHDLVASFHSTLEEARHATLLLYVVDAGDPNYQAQLAVVEEALKSVGVSQTPVLLVFNKIDTVPPQLRNALRLAYPDALQVSALVPADAARLREAIVDFFEKRMKQEEVFVPWGKEGVLGELRESLRVLRESHEETGIRYQLRCEPGVLNRLRKRLAATNK